MRKGWYCWHRQIFDHPIGSNVELVGVWSIFLGKAAVKKHTFYFGGQKVILRKGEFIFGRKSFAEKFNFSERKIRRILKIFEKEKLISVKASNRFSTIHILNWGKYQNIKVQSVQQKSNRSPASVRQPATINKVNKENKENKSSDEKIIFQKFSKWLKNSQTQIKLPDRYASRIFKKYPWQIIRKVVDDSACRSLPKFRELVEFYLSRARNRGETFKNF